MPQDVLALFAEIKIQLSIRSAVKFHVARPLRTTSTG